VKPTQTGVIFLNSWSLVPNKGIILARIYTLVLLLLAYESSKQIWRYKLHSKYPCYEPFWTIIPIYTKSTLSHHLLSSEAIPEILSQHNTVHLHHLFDCHNHHQTESEKKGKPKKAFRPHFCCRLLMRSAADKPDMAMRLMEGGMSPVEQ
jgi:hypothetical protein